MRPAVLKNSFPLPFDGIIGLGRDAVRRPHTSLHVALAHHILPHLLPTVSTSPACSSSPDPVPVEEPVQLGRANLSAAERLRCQEAGLCMSDWTLCELLPAVTKKREAVELYIKDSLAAGLIRPSSSPVAAGFFFVDKKDKTLSPCVDYRGLNKITIKNKCPLPVINSAFEPLHKATIFTKLDLRNAYYLVRVRQGVEWKTAFNTPLGHFEHLVMPFFSC